MEPSFNIGVKSAESRKKRRSVVLEDNIDNRKFAATKVSSGHSWGSETSNTTESDSVNMEKKCLVEETNFDFGEGGIIVDRDLEQTPKSSKIQTKRVFCKPLGKIDFLGDNNNNNDILLDKPVVLPPSLKNLINVSIRKSFVLDISFNNVVGKSTQEKLVVIKKLFSKINGFGEVSTPSKFAGIVRVMFISKLSLVKATKLATDVKILVNTDLKKSSGHSDQTVVVKEISVGMSVETVCIVLFKFGIIKSVKIQLNQADLLASRWSILIGKNAIHVARANLDKQTWNFRDLHKTLLYTLSVRTNAHDIWDYIGFIAESLNTVMGTTPVLRGAYLHWSYLSSVVYAKCNKMGHTSLNCVSGADIVMSKSSGVVTGSEAVTEVVVFDPAVISKMEETLNNLLITVMSLSAKINNADINVPAKQEDIVHWHKESGNLVSIVTEMKLRSSCRPWIKNKFDDIRVFTFGLDVGFLDTRMAIIMNIFLVCHVYKIPEVSDRLFSIKLLFKNKLSVLILGLYAGAFLAVHFAQAGEVNFLIVKAVNESSFVVLGGDFNEDRSHKCASFKKCSDFGLVNSLSESSFGADVPMWTRFKDASAANTAMFSDNFIASKQFSDLDVMWNTIRKFGADVDDFVSLIKCWCSLDSAKASVIQDLMDSGVIFDCVYLALCIIRKSYCVLKYAESLRAKKANIRSVIDKRMESFKTNKGHTIRSVLECLFCKIVLNHLVVNDKLVLKLGLVKSKVDAIIEIPDVFSKWHCQYQPLEYVFDGAFSGVMCSIEIDEFFGVVSNLPNGKAAEAWILMISKLYEWESVLTNTHPIALIKTACKVFSKILSNRIFLACNTFNVLYSNNFPVLKGTTTQFPIFAIGSVIEDALKKNRKLWLKSLVRIKMFITDFGLMDGYNIHDRLNQEKILFLLLWCIFYDLLLCEVKHQESMCRYRINSHFISRSGCAKSWAGFFSFLVADAFVDNTIWVGSSQNAIQYILNINDISIINDKTVAIFINSRVSHPFLFISGLPISVTRKGESHQYVGIFLSTKSLFKPSLTKAHLNVHFFTNLVLKKAVLGKQFLYLVLVVLYPIVSYKTQFSFVSISVCNNKIASLISFVNSGGILGLLFSHKSHDLQVLYWHSLHLLSSPACIHVSASNNFLLGMSLFFKFLFSLWHYGIVFVNQLCDYHGDWWKKLDSYGLVSDWFKLSVAFLVSPLPSFPALDSVGLLNICGSSDFVSVCDHLFQVGSDSLSVYTDGSLKNLGTIGCWAGAAAFFENINLGLGVSVRSLVLSTLAELQTITLALKCILMSHSVCLFSDNQAALDACKSELNLMHPDFCNQCWVKHWHISNIICSKNLEITWCKVKSHFGILRNNCANSLTDTASFFGWFLSLHVGEHFLVADDDTVSGNSRHFEVGSSSGFLAGGLLSDVDWFSSSQVWHSDLHMAAGFTSRCTADTHTYFMKALHRQLLIAEIKMFDHVFSCTIDISAHHKILEFCVSSWKELSGHSLFLSSVLQLLSACASDFSVFLALFKGFVFNEWFSEAVSVFHDPKVARIKVAEFVHSLCLAFRDDIWLIHAKHRAFMEKHGLISIDGSAPVSVSGSALKFSAGLVKLLGISETFDVQFGFCKPCLFFSGIGTLVSVNIIA
ncbi:hypothetical protein G9A89_020009 [Geosiphon pyriformis]|nr:hypothetical protein G9A89_020009 [Geosiphon pyriformis]